MSPATRAALEQGLENIEGIADGQLIYVSILIVGGDMHRDERFGVCVSMSARDSGSI